MAMTAHSPEHWFVPANNSCKSKFLMDPVNVSDMYPAQCRKHSKFVFGTVIPALAVCVTVANSIIVAVFMKPHIRSHTTFILTMIAIADTLGILLPTTTYVYVYSLGNHQLPFYLCMVVYVLASVLKNVFNFISVWLTVMLAYIRYKCIHSPFTARSFHRGRNITIATGAIFFMAFAVCVPELFEMSFSPSDRVNDTMNETFRACAISSSEWFGDEYPCSYRRIHLWLEMIVSSLIPCTILFGLDISILKTLRKATICRDSLRRRDTYHPACKKTKGKKGTKDHIQHIREIADDRIINEADNLDKFEQDPNLVKSSTKRVNISYAHKNTYRSSHMMSKEVTKSKLCSTPSNSSARSVLGKMSRVRNIMIKNKKKRNNSVHSEDSAYDRLDRESRRTSWLIIMVITIITSHEIPVSIMLAYTLASTTGPLPLNLFGCATMYVQLWGYIAYPLIFLIYCNMSAAFRHEIWRVVTWRCLWKKEDHDDCVKMNPFMSPCSVRRSLTRMVNKPGIQRDSHHSVSGHDDDLMTIPDLEPHGHSL